MSSIDNKTLSTISQGPPEEALKFLIDFNTLHESHKDFTNISPSTKQELWDSIFTRLKASSISHSNPTLVKAALNSLRLLSREKPSLEQAMTDDRIRLLLQISGLGFGLNTIETETEETEQLPKQLEEPHPPVEALKVIFNMIFQSSILQVMFITNGMLESLVKKVQSFNPTESNTNPTDIIPAEEDYKYFTLRILFLITALCNQTAPLKVRRSFNGLSIMNNFLDSQISNTSFLSDSSCDIMCEALKVTYNLIHDLGPSKRSSDMDIDKDDLEQLNLIAKSVRVLLLFPSTHSSKIGEIKRHSIDLLAALPPPCFTQLTPKIQETSEEPLQPQQPQFQFEDFDLSAVEYALQYLETKLDIEQDKGTLPSDNLAPPLCALHNMACSSRAIRKYLKLRILPPLNRNDVMNLPEVGNTVRNKLCALLTSPATHITQLVANLLFVLCKENTRKLTKYTGYGNAAGLLANRGLMLGGKAPKGKYSDTEDDESSDTEEYKEVEHLINPVEGRIGLDRPDPMEGMTDEQKQAEAMKLINAIDKMERNSGFIKPCRIGPDGRPVPIQHVLQLQEALENPIKSMRRNEDSDSDSD